MGCRIDSPFLDSGSYMGESEFRNKVTWYNFILSLLVVLIHAVNLVPSNGILQERIREMAAGGASGLALLPYRIEDFFSNGLAQAAVPGFFLMAGYLFYRTLHGFSDIRRKWQERFWSILIPYCAWNTIYYLLYVLIGRARFSLSGLSEAAAQYTYNPVFWYIYQLIILTFLAPMLTLVLRRTWSGKIFLIAVFTYLAAGHSFPALNADALFYYSVGAYLAMQSNTSFIKASWNSPKEADSILDEIQYEKKRTTWFEENHPLAGLIMLLAAAALTTLTVSFFNAHISGPALIAILPEATVTWLFSSGGQSAIAVAQRTLLALGFFLILPGEKLPSAEPYLQNTFLLYTIHFPIVRLIFHMLYRLSASTAPATIVAGSWLCLMIYFLLPPFCCFAAYWIKKFLKKFCPKAGNLLLGGR